MKQKSSKLKKLEKNRYSILTDNLENCYLCNAPKTDMHEIYGGSNRKISMMNGFCIPLCRSCHNIITNMPLYSEELKMETQQVFEKTHTREEFVQLIRRNYL